MAKRNETTRPPVKRKKTLGIKIGEQLTIAKLVGRGRLGYVYAGVHPVLARRFAIRVFRTELTRTKKVQQRLRHMVREASTVDHPNVVSLVDFGTLDDGRVFLASDYVRGIQLTMVLEQESRVPVPRILHLLIQLAGALEAAHRARVVHGDLKPTNVLLVEQPDDPPHLWLTDLKLTQALSIDYSPDAPLRHLRICSSVDYLSPELIKGRRLDIGSDIYSFGALAYRLLTGEPPFVGSPQEVVKAHRTREPVPPSRRAGTPDIPSDLDSVVLRCLQKHPGDRFPNMEAVARMLRTMLGGVDVTPRIERVSDTIPILKEEPEQQPLPESPARLRQLFFDSIYMLSKHMLVLRRATREMADEVEALTRTRQDAQVVSARGESTENRFEDVRQVMREREATLRYAIIDLNLARSDEGGDIDPRDVEFQIAELERSLGKLEAERVEQFATLKVELNKHREQYKNLEQRMVLHYRRLYAHLEDVMDTVDDQQSLQMYQLIERCRAAMAATQHRRG